MLNTNFTSWPLFSEEEADSVRNVLLSNKVNYWTRNLAKLIKGRRGWFMQNELISFEKI